jgi:hypothetical protein
MKKPISFMSARIFVLCFGVLITLAYCRPNKKDSNKNAISISDVDSSQLDSVRNMVYLMLSPNEILNEIFSQNITLNPQLLNPRNNASKYLDIRHQASNLGVYIADFAYLNLCRNKTNALDYFKIIRDLAQKNNIYGCFDETIFNRIQNNLANNDSLISISQEMYYNMSDILENANRQNINALISSGTLIETLYLSVMSVDKMPDHQQIIHKILEQKLLFDNFYAFISLYKKDSDVQSMLNQLDNLKKILDKLTSKSTREKITKGKNNHIEVKGGQDIIVNEAIFNDFKENVVKVRQEIISISTK